MEQSKNSHKNIDIINKIQRAPRFTWDDFPQKNGKLKPYTIKFKL